MPNRPVRLVTRFTLLLSLAAPIAAAQAANPAQATVNPATLAERDLAAESRGNVAAALALYANDAVIQNGGLCWTPCVGKAAIQKELERRVAAINRPKVVAQFVSGDVAILKTEVGLSYVDKSGVRRSLQWSPGVDRVIVWDIYEIKDGKIAVVTTLGQRTDPQTARFIAWSRSFSSKTPKKPSSR
jgi:hypothetical protein